MSPVFLPLARAIPAFAFIACGAATDLDVENRPSSIEPPASRPRPTFVFGDASSPPAPLACTSCATARECPTAICVVSTERMPFCAPGCSKDGYCTSDRKCVLVTDPGGQAWRACLPLAGCGVRTDAGAGGDSAAR